MMHVDVREARLIEVLRSKFPGLAFDVKQLDVGDVYFEARVQEEPTPANNTDCDQDGIETMEQEQDTHSQHSKTVQIFVERKTIADVAASLKDGRWHEQKLRLVASGARIIYVIEGYAFDEAKPVCGINGKAIATMLWNAVMRDNIHIVHTKNVEQTACALAGLASRLHSGSTESWFGSCSKAAQELERRHQLSLLKCKRKDNITESTTFKMQLCTIPGISACKADAVCATLNVHSMLQLVTLLNQQAGGGPSAFVQLLCKVPGIGKCNAVNILQHLGFQQNINT